MFSLEMYAAMRREGRDHRGFEKRNAQEACDIQGKRALDKEWKQFKACKQFSSKLKA